MSKLNVFDISGVLMSKNGLDDKESRRFVKAMFDVIQECLDEDKVVKVKGLGTFKIIEVDDRESINVNTGERVLIEGHSKLTFTPDSVMKEIVNKPFSQFETVILNDGVDFPEPTIDEPVAEEPIGEEPIGEEPIREEPIAEEPIAEISGLSDTSELSDNSGLSDNSELSDNSGLSGESAPSEDPAILNVNDEAASTTTDSSIVEFTDDNEETPSVSETPAENEQSGEPENPIDEEIIEEEESGNPTLRWVLSGVVVLLLILGAAYGGYQYGRYELSEEMAYKQMQTDLKAAEMTAKKAQAAMAKDTVAQEVDATKIGAMSIDKEKDEAAKDESKEETKKEEPAKVEPVKEQPAKQATDKYGAMDARVRTGAYRIIGEDKTVKAKAGQTVEDIANRLLGPGMSCYVEVFNGLEAKAPLKEGQAIKIPKLELKKRR